MELLTHTLRQCACVLASRERAQQLRDAVVEGVALLEEDAIDPRAQPLVHRNHHGRQRQRERGSTDAGFDAEQPRRELAEPWHHDEAGAHEGDEHEVVGRRRAQQAVDVEEVEARDRNEEGDGEEEQREVADQVDRALGDFGLDRDPGGDGEPGKERTVAAPQNPLCLAATDRIQTPVDARRQDEKRHAKKEGQGIQGAEKERVRNETQKEEQQEGSEEPRTHADEPTHRRSGGAVQQESSKRKRRDEGGSRDEDRGRSVELPPVRAEPLGCRDDGKAEKGEKPGTHQRRRTCA